MQQPKIYVKRANAFENLNTRSATKDAFIGKILSLFFVVHVLARARPLSQTVSTYLFPNRPMAAEPPAKVDRDIATVWPRGTLELRERSIAFVPTVNEVSIEWLFEDILR